MLAKVITEFGNTNIFQTKELPKPTVKPGYVLIDVKATSINPVDLKIRSGVYGHIAPDFPAILHGDVAGVIVEVGEGVTAFQVGDEVYGCAGGVKGSNGALSEFMLADAKLIALKPKTISMLEAAALPLVAITAWEALVDKVQIRKDQKVLIHGGVGGVGHIAVQLAKSLGADVYTTVSSEENAKLITCLPAANIINYRKEEVKQYVDRITNGKGFKIVFDTVGAENLEASLQAMSVYGTVVTTQANITLNLAPLHTKAGNLKVVLMLIPLLVNEHREHHGKILKEIATLVDAGQIKPLIYPKQFTMDDVDAAHALAESGKGYGKIVLERVTG